MSRSIRGTAKSPSPRRGRRNGRPPNAGGRPRASVLPHRPFRAVAQQLGRSVFPGFSLRSNPGLDSDALSGRDEGAGAALGSPTGPTKSAGAGFGPHAPGSGKVVCMTAIRVEIIRLYQNGYPDWADCRLVDAAGREHFFHEKVPVVSAADIDENSELPQPGAIGCEIIARRVDAEGREVIQVDTTKPWAIESNAGESRFEVLQSQLIELS